MVMQDFEVFTTFLEQCDEGIFISERSGDSDVLVKTSVIRLEMLEVGE